MSVLPREALPPLFQTMLDYPESRSHMLFLGPPGSGKTTTAQSFACALHGKKANRFASLLFLNSSDERSLETIRQKIYPFIESRMQSLFFTPGQVPPKILIFDEAETLTDQAQCALRPLLQRATSEVLIIFICNSLSHIHPEILNKFLLVPFTPTPNERLQAILDLKVPKLDSLFRRGDIRFFKQCPDQARTVTRFLMRALHVTSPDELFTLVTGPGSPPRERVSWLLLFHQLTGTLESSEDIQLWSALTASETQPHLSDTDYKDILWKLWCRLMCSATVIGAGPG